jgi:hypothetical protein
VRTDFDPAAEGPGRFYRLLNSVVVPRPIAWVSSTSADGVDNLAPHSFFTVASVAPPIVQFTSVGSKDTLRNVRQTGEFVVNLAPEPMFEQINETATDYPPDIGEFDAAGVRSGAERAGPAATGDRITGRAGMPPPSDRPGRRLPRHPRRGAASRDPQRRAIDGHPDVRLLRPLARLGRDEWCTVGDVREIKRCRYRP